MKSPGEDTKAKMVDITKKCLIISGGDFTNKEHIRALTSAGKSGADTDPDSVFVIACDRGYEHAKKLGITPDVIVGDFDSSDASKAAAAEVLTFPVHKDDTDTMLAIRHALSLGYEDIEICCALGGRLDHLFANIQALGFAAFAGAKIMISADDTSIIAAKGPVKLTVPYEEGRSLSVFSLRDECRGVSIRGTEYEAENAVLTNAFPIGVSNGWKGKEPAEVSAESGIILVMTCRMP